MQVESSTLNGPTRARAEHMNFEGFPTSEVTKIITIGPNLAKAWLTRNIRNRRLSPMTVKDYARDMKNGRWDNTGEPVKFDKNGVLLDGQHRLHAIIAADVPIVADVRFGLHPGSFINMDSHKKRKAADFLYIKGEANATIIASALQSITAYDNGQYRSIGHNYLTNEEVLVAFDKHPNVKLSVPFGSGSRDYIPFALSTALHYLARRVDQGKADFFWNRLADGAELSINSPIRMLREKLHVERLSKRAFAVRNERAALVIKAFNAFVIGAETKVLRWRTGGNNPESFPTFVDFNPLT